MVVPLLIAIITFTGLIYMRLEEQGRTISEIFTENQQTTPEVTPVAEEQPQTEEEEEEEEEQPVQVDPDTGVRIYPTLYDGTTEINMSYP